MKIHIMATPEATKPVRGLLRPLYRTLPDYYTWHSTGPTRWKRGATFKVNGAYGRGLSVPIRSTTDDYVPSWSVVSHTKTIALSLSHSPSLLAAIRSRKSELSVFNPHVSPYSQAQPLST